MPNCKNDINSKYIGNEPSPKGLGYCAHAENLGTIKKGNDGNKWIVTKNKNNVKKWKKYEKKVGKKYYVHDNGGRPFEVIVDKKNNIYIYKQSNLNIEIYDKLVKKFVDVKKIYIGKDSKYKNLNGNTILLELKNGKFVCIMWDIFEFKLEPGDEVVKYFSEVGNSDVPYPVLLGKKNFYSMIEKTFASLNYFPPNYKTADFESAHNFYYGNFIKGKGWVSDVKEKHKLHKLKIIHKRIW